MRRCFLLCIACTVGAAVAAATSYVIAPDGSGDWPTIQAGVDGASRGDTLFLADGIFTGDGNRDIDPLGKELAFLSLGGDPQNCIIDCAGSEADPHRGFAFGAGEDSTVIAGLTVRNGYANGDCCEDLTGGAIRCMYSSSPVISNCIFQSNHAVTDGGAILCSSYSCPQIRDCLFIGNQAAVGGAINCGGFANAIVSRCTFISNAASSAPSCGGAIYVKLFAAPVFENCTLFDNAAMTGCGIYCLFSAAPVFNNTIISYGENGAAVYTEDSTPLFNCCDIYGNEGGDWTDGIAEQLGTNGNFSADPIFCDPANGVLTLHVDSPCLPGAAPECGLIGAWPIGCPDTGVPPIPGAPSVAVESRPNPFCSQTDFLFAAPQAATSGDLAILDASGRIVRQLWKSQAASGAQRITWDGRDDAGRRLPPGLYFHELRLGPARSIGRVLLLR